MGGTSLWRSVPGLFVLAQATLLEEACEFNLFEYEATCLRFACTRTGAAQHLDRRFLPALGQAGRMDLRAGCTGQRETEEVAALGTNEVFAYGILWELRFFPLSKQRVLISSFVNCNRSSATSKLTQRSCRSMARQDCLLLDVFQAKPDTDKVPLQLDLGSLQAAPYADCSFRTFWAKGRGLALDWVPKEPRLCQLYQVLLVEDEYVLDSFRREPPACRIFPLDPHKAAELPFVPLPWAPGEPLPDLSRIVSFHAYSVYSAEAQSNPQRWLQEPDFWNAHFTELMQQGMLTICLTEESCQGDSAPYRLMFWEDISTEFLQCIARGITPIFLGTPSIYEYVERNVLLTRWRFETATEMMAIISTLSSPQGVLEHGTRVFMERQGNYFLSRLYWRQDPRLRALLLASAAQRQQRLQPATEDASDSPVMEVVVCVASAAQNRPARDIIRTTWGSEPYLRTGFGFVLIRVLFFLGQSDEATAEHKETGDIVLLPDLPENFSSIWLKTAAILKFGADYFKAANGSGRLRFLIKCDDDAFLDIDAVAADIMGSAPVGLLWGHVMALVEPNRNASDKYFVPYEVYPMQYYPPYARGMAYALSEDVVLPLGAALYEGRLDPFPYREDVSVGLYILELARSGHVRVVPHQRKDAMPLDFKEHCAGPQSKNPVLVMHRFDPATGPCLWQMVQERRREVAKGATRDADFCSCSQLLGKQDQMDRMRSSRRMSFSTSLNHWPPLAIFGLSALSKAFQAGALTGGC
ncbi:GALT1 [Symbiodinium natans]|uniref:GALT1 protein n=1 Tax=Symbiodinium natans TaxID=878477 RepID=A0A812MB43_9DINO|nr:GALT1 [Symbiodinium natans]